MSLPADKDLNKFWRELRLRQIPEKLSAEEAERRMETAPDDALSTEQIDDIVANVLARTAAEQSAEADESQLVETVASEPTGKLLHFPAMARMQQVAAALLLTVFLFSAGWKIIPWASSKNAILRLEYAVAAQIAVDTGESVARRGTAMAIVSERLRLALIELTRFATSEDDLAGEVGIVVEGVRVMLRARLDATAVRDQPSVANLRELLEDVLDTGFTDAVRRSSLQLLESELALGLRLIRRMDDSRFASGRVLAGIVLDLIPYDEAVRVVGVADGSPIWRAGARLCIGARVQTATRNLVRVARVGADLRDDARRVLLRIDSQIASPREIDHPANSTFEQAFSDAFESDASVFRRREALRVLEGWLLTGVFTVQRLVSDPAASGRVSESSKSTLRSWTAHVVGYEAARRIALNDRQPLYLRLGACNNVNRIARTAERRIRWHAQRETTSETGRALSVVRAALVGGVPIIQPTGSSRSPDELYDEFLAASETWRAESLLALARESALGIRCLRELEECEEPKLRTLAARFLRSLRTKLAK